MHRTLLPVPLLVLAACVDRVEAPTAAIAPLPDAAAYPGQPVALDGGDSSDPGGAQLAYHWRLVAVPTGSAAELLADDRQIVALVPDLYGDYVVGLVVDNGLLTSEEVTATLTVAECGLEAPVVSALSADPVAPSVGAVVQLGATVSDPDVACDLGGELTRSWAIAARPAGSAAALDDPRSSNPWFVADVPGTYEVELVVTDATGRASEVGRLPVVASECGGAAPTVAFSMAAVDHAVGALVTLNVLPDDPDNDPAGCNLGQTLTVWSEIVDAPAGSAATLAPSTGTSPSFVPDVPGEYVVRMTVADPTGRTASQEAAIAVGECGSRPPVASAAITTPDQAGPGASVSLTVPDGLVVGLTAASSTDPDFEAPCTLPGALSWSWRFLSKPPGSTAALNDPTIEDPSFVPDEPGDYLLTVAVSDGQHTDEALVHVVADPALHLGAAVGYAVTYEAGGSQWAAPQGIAVDADGRAYVVQNQGHGVIVVETDGSSRYLTLGGYLMDPQDVVYDATLDDLVVSDRGTDRLARVTLGGLQSAWTASNDVDEPTGLALFGRTLVVADRNQDELVLYNADSTGIAAATGTRTFNGNLDQPWGVAAASATVFYAANEGSGDVRKWTGSVDLNLYGNFDNLADLARTPGGDLVVAEPQQGTVWVVDDCASPPCAVTPIAWGPWEPWGLAFDGPDLLVTDRAGDALFRVTGAF